MGARTSLVVACLLLALTAGGATAVTPAALLGAYAVESDAAVATARDAIEAAGPRTPAARVAVADLDARLTLLADALRASTRGQVGPAATAVASRIAGDATVAAAVGGWAEGTLGADDVDAAIAAARATDAEARAAILTDDAGGGGFGPADIAQAVGGPGLLVATVAVMALRSARRRRETARR